MWDEIICSKNLGKGEYPAILRVHYYGQRMESATIHEAGNSQESVILSGKELLALAETLKMMIGEIKRGVLDDGREADTDG